MCYWRVPSGKVGGQDGHTKALLTTTPRTAYRPVRLHSPERAATKPVHVAVLTIPQPANRATEVGRASTTHQDASAKCNNSSEFRRSHLSGTQRQDLSGCADNGGHGWAQAWGVLGVSGLETSINACRLTKRRTRKRFAYKQTKNK